MRVKLCTPALVGCLLHTGCVLAQADMPQQDPLLTAWWLPVAGATLAASLSDNGWYTLTQSEARALRPMKHFSVFGEPWWSIGVLGGLYAGSANAPDSSSSAGRTAWTGVRGMVSTLAGVQGLKMLAGRERPYVAAGRGNWRGPNLQPRSWSFPSGHTAMAFSWATTLSYTLPEPEYNRLRIGAYTLSALVGISRMVSNHHWFSDVVAGAGLGYLVTKAAWEYDDPRLPSCYPLVQAAPGLRCNWDVG